MFHPAAYLFTWLLAALILPFMGQASLIAIFLCILLGGKTVWQRWGKQIVRAKWLLLTLWLVLAYGIPGDLWQGMAWAPSIEGMAAANLHVMRLVVLLGTLAWLFCKLTHQQFIVSLWVMTFPFRRLGMDSDRTVARLALVFDYLEQAPPKGSWRHFLDEPAEGGQVLETLQLMIPRWQGRDTLWLTGMLTALFCLGWIG